MKEEREGLVALIEALLFAAREPVPVHRLAQICGVAETDAAWALGLLGTHLTEARHGVEVAEVAGGFRLFTKKAFASHVEAMLQPVRSQLSAAALETLAVIAYRQPVTRLDVEAIRGVQCEHSLRTLLERQLIREVGRKAAPGRPILYGTTPAFLEHFGLRSLAELPPPDAFAGGGRWEGNR